MNQATASLQQGRVLNRALVIIVAVLAAALLGWFLFQARNSDAGSRKAADQFVNLLAAKDATASYEMLTDGSKALMPADSWQAWVEFAFAEITGNPVFVEELPVEEPAATYGEGAVVARFVYSFTIDNKSYKAAFVLVQKDGVWKVSEIGAFE